MPKSFLFAILTAYILLSSGCNNHSKPVKHIDLWTNGLPNSNGMDTLLAYDNTRNFKPSLRVYLPKENPSGRAVIAFQGGGYYSLTDELEDSEWVSFYNKQGIALIVLQYRMPNGNHEVPISDAKEAMRIVKENAKEWNINPSEIGIMGSSAGGHLATFIATHAESELRPNFLILFYPVITMDRVHTENGTKYNLLGEAPSTEQIEYYSNEKHVDSETPRTIIFLSQDDPLVPPTNGINYHQALLDKGIESELEVYPNGGHGWSIPKKVKHYSDMQNKLSDWLKKF